MAVYTFYVARLTLTGIGLASAVQDHTGGSLVAWGGAHACMMVEALTCTCKRFAATRIAFGVQ